VRSKVLTLRSAFLQDPEEETVFGEFVDSLRVRRLLTERKVGVAREAFSLGTESGRGVSWLLSHEKGFCSGFTGGNTGVAIILGESLSGGSKVLGESTRRGRDGIFLSCALLEKSEWWAPCSCR